MQQLVEQLDLLIYKMPFSFWWQSPLVLISLSILFISLIMWIVFRRRKKKRIQLTLPEALFIVLTKGLDSYKEGSLAGSDAALLLTTALKSYTAWLSHDSTVHGLTDQQWLDKIKNMHVFDPYYESCIAIIRQLNEIKFNYGQIDKAQLVHLFEKVLEIISQIQAHASK